MDHVKDKLRVVEGKKQENSHQKRENTLNGSQTVKLDLSGLRHEVGLVGELASFTFEAWDEDKQQAAKEACLAFVERPQSMLLWSKQYGSGKTYAAAAILSEYIQRDIHRRDEQTGISMYYQDGGSVLPNGPAWEVAGLFVKMQTFFAEIKSKIGEQSRDVLGMVNVLERTPLLVMDDLCRAEPSPFENEIIYRVIDHRGNMGLPLVATTNASPAELSKWLWGATASRLKRATYVHMEEVDYR